MKGYRFLVPILLIITMLYSTYSHVSINIENKKKYDTYVEKAREYASQGIVVDSLDNYKEAIAMIDTVDMRIEAAEMLVKNEFADESVAWLEGAVEKYPKSSKLYEKLLKQYISTENFDKSYELIDEIQKRNLVTKSIKELYSTIKYKYELDLDRYENVTSLGESYFAITKNEKQGLLYKDKTVLFNQFDYIGSYSDELISVSYEGEYYYVDKDGNKRKVPPKEIKCEYLGDICEGLIVVKENGKYGYYDKEFKKQFGEYDYATNFNEGIAAVKKENHWYLMDKKGKQIGDRYYSDIKKSENNIAFKNERAFVLIDDNYYMVDKNGKIIGDSQYEDAKVFEEKNSYAAVKVGGTWSFVDKNGKKIFDAAYDEAKSFSLEVGAVKKDGHWGFVDKNGKMVITNTFTDVKPFSSEGITYVSDTEGWMMLSLYRYMD